MVKSNVTNGKPYTWRHVSTVWGEYSETAHRKVGMALGA